MSEFVVSSLGALGTAQTAYLLLRWILSGGARRAWLRLRVGSRVVVAGLTLTAQAAEREMRRAA